jgi:hypothetical protein
VIFCSNIIKTPKSSSDRAKREREREKEKRRRKKQKLQECLQIKEEVNILRGEKHFNFKNSF